MQCQHGTGTEFSAETWLHAVESIAPKEMTKKKVARSFINMVFQQMPEWQKELLRLQLLRDPASILYVQLLQCFYPIMYNVIKLDFAPWKILRALDLAGGACLYSAYELNWHIQVGEK